MNKYSIIKSVGLRKLRKLIYKYTGFDIVEWSFKPKNKNYVFSFECLNICANCEMD